MKRKRSNTQKALELFNSALKGDVDAFTKIVEILKDDDIEIKGDKNGKNK